MSLLDQVIDVSFDPFGLTIRTSHETVTMRVGPGLPEDARAALGKLGSVELGIGSLWPRIGSVELGIVSLFYFW